jgi:hypothetical protein
MDRSTDAVKFVLREPGIPLLTRVSADCDLAEDGRLLDDLEQRVSLDDDLDRGDLVPGQRHEPGRVPSNVVIRRRLDLDVLDTAVEAALADERPEAGVTDGCRSVVDPLIRIAEEVLALRKLFVRD